LAADEATAPADHPAQRGHYRDIGSRAIKGYEQPVRVWRLLRGSSIDSRFEALRAGGAAPPFGGEGEPALLLHRWRGL
jgi:hypothetical protein